MDEGQQLRDAVQCFRRLTDKSQRDQDAAMMRQTFARLGQYRRALRSGTLTPQEQEALATMLEMFEDYMREWWALYDKDLQ
jgi:hypothetical protein